MRESDIRQELIAFIAMEHGPEPATAVLQEVGVCEHKGRIDMVALNGRLHGFEIKSPQDSLDRLPNQAQLFSLVFDTVTLVLSRGHMQKARDIIPRWWGIAEASESNGEVRIKRRRQARLNRVPNLLSQAQLLWRNEALSALESVGCANGLRSKPRSILWEALSSRLGRDELGRVVRLALKSRNAGQADRRQKPCDGSCRRRAKSLHSRVRPVLTRIAK